MRRPGRKSRHEGRLARARAHVLRDRRPPTTGPLTVGDCVSALKLLADKGAAIIDYMRKAGKFEDTTVNEITYRVGDAIRKAGALLEDIAPPDGRPTEKSAPSRRLYEDILNEAKVAERTARDWRAASKLGTEAYSKYLAVAEAAEQYFARAKDATKLYEAIEAKLVETASVQGVRPPQSARRPRQRPRSRP